MSIDFNKWRDDYQQMSYDDQVKFYNEVAKRWPEQIDFHFPSWLRFFKYVHDGLGPFSIFEIGGWKGEMAQAVFDTAPDLIKRTTIRGGKQQLPTWVNFEISEEALTGTVVTDPRYQAKVPPDFAWNVAIPNMDVFIASHTIEHITEENFVALLDNLPSTVVFIGLESPLRPSDVSRDWGNYTGSHILEIGWKEVAEHLADFGFYAIKELDGFNPKENSNFHAFLLGAAHDLYR